MQQPRRGVRGSGGDHDMRRPVGSNIHHDFRAGGQCLAIAGLLVPAVAVIAIVDEGLNTGMLGLIESSCRRIRASPRTVIWSVLAALHDADMTTTIPFAVKHSRTPLTCPLPSTYLSSQSGFQSGSSPKLLMIQTRRVESPENGVHWRTQLASYAGLETSDGQAGAMASKRSGNQVSGSADRGLLLGWRRTMSASGQRHQHHGGLLVRREPVAAWNGNHRDVQRTVRTRFNHGLSSGPPGPGWNRDQFCAANKAGALGFTAVLKSGCDGGPSEERARPKGLVLMKVLVLTRDDEKNVNSSRFPITQRGAKLPLL